MICIGEFKNLLFVFIYMYIIGVVRDVYFYEGKAPMNQTRLPIILGVKEERIYREARALGRASRPGVYMHIGKGIRVHRGERITAAWRRLVKKNRHRELGRIGELLVINYLEKQGVNVLDLSKEGRLYEDGDMVADNNALVEVKSGFEDTKNVGFFMLEYQQNNHRILKLSLRLQFEHCYLVIYNRDDTYSIYFQEGFYSYKYHHMVFIGRYTLKDHVEVRYDTE